MAQLDQIFKRVTPKVRPNVNMTPSGATNAGAFGGGGGGYGGGGRSIDDRLDMAEAELTIKEALMDRNIWAQKNRSEFYEDRKTKEEIDLQYEREMADYQLALSDWTEQNRNVAPEDMKAARETAPIRPQRETQPHTPHYSNIDDYLGAVTHGLTDGKDETYTRQVELMARELGLQYRESDLLEKKNYEDFKVYDKGMGVIDKYMDLGTEEGYAAAHETAKMLYEDGIIQAEGEGGYDQLMNVIDTHQDVRIMQNLWDNDIKANRFSGSLTAQKERMKEDEYYNKYQEMIHQNGENRGITTKEAWDKQVDAMFAQTKFDRDQTDADRKHRSVTYYDKSLSDIRRAHMDGQYQELRDLKETVLLDMDRPGMYDNATLDRLLLQIDQALTPDRPPTGEDYALLSKILVDGYQNNTDMRLIEDAIATVPGVPFSLKQKFMDKLDVAGGFENVMNAVRQRADTLPPDLQQPFIDYYYNGLINDNIHMTPDMENAMENSLDQAFAQMTDGEIKKLYKIREMDSGSLYDEPVNAAQYHMIDNVNGRMARNSGLWKEFQPNEAGILSLEGTLPQGVPNLEAWDVERALATRYQDGTDMIIVPLNKGVMTQEEMGDLYEGQQSPVLILRKTTDSEGNVSYSKFSAEDQQMTMGFTNGEPVLTSHKRTDGGWEALTPQRGFTDFSFVNKEKAEMGMGLDMTGIMPDSLKRIMFEQAITQGSETGTVRQKLLNNGATYVNYTPETDLGSKSEDNANLRIGIRSAEGLLSKVNRTSQENDHINNVYREASALESEIERLEAYKIEVAQRLENQQKVMEETPGSYMPDGYDIRKQIADEIEKADEQILKLQEEFQPFEHFLKTYNSKQNAILEKNPDIEM